MMDERSPIHLYPRGMYRMYTWPYVYLHGKAEDHGWNINAPDLFSADRPIPTEPGNYICVLQGQYALAVLRQNRFNSRDSVLEGRVALLTDTEALNHALDYQNWR